jgi:hypothetical protein
MPLICQDEPLRFEDLQEDSSIESSHHNDLDSLEPEHSSKGANLKEMPRIREDEPLKFEYLQEDSSIESSIHNDLDSVEPEQSVVLDSDHRETSLGSLWGESSVESPLLSDVEIYDDSGDWAMEMDLRPSGLPGLLASIQAATPLSKITEHSREATSVTYGDEDSFPLSSPLGRFKSSISGRSPSYSDRDKSPLALRAERKIRKNLRESPAGGKLGGSEYVTKRFQILEVLCPDLPSGSFPEELEDMDDEEIESARSA